MKNIQGTGKHYGEVITVKQVSKAAAKKLFSQGKQVFLQSSNMRPFNSWQSICEIKIDDEQLKSEIDLQNFSIKLYTEQINKYKESTEDWDADMLNLYETKLQAEQAKVIDASSQFNSICNNYSYYNLDSERGKYIHFYTTI